MTAKKKAIKKWDAKEFASRAIKAGNKMHVLFTEGDEDGMSMMESLYADFKHHDTDVPTKLKIAAFFAHHSQQRELMAISLGLTKNQPTQKADKITNIQINGDMSFEDRLKLIEAEVAGVKTIQPPEADDDS